MSSTSPFFLDLHFGLVQAVNVRTNVGSVAAPAHDPVGPRDAAPGDHIHGVRAIRALEPDKGYCGTKYIYMSTAVPLDRAGTAGFRGWDLLLP